MAYPMIALTTAGTAFACASVSLTETGLAVLDDDGSRIGFVPYDSLEYVAPTEEARVNDAPIQVHVEDGSTFGAASLSRTGAGVAVQDHSGSRVGFVPDDTLTYALPASKTGPTLPADATPPEGVAIDEEDDGGSPVWEGDRERSDEHGEDAENDEQASDGRESDDGVWGDDPEAESDRAESDGERKDGSADSDATADASTGGDDSAEQSAQGGGESDEGASTDPELSGGEEAEASELVVEWSFGENA